MRYGIISIFMISLLLISTAQIAGAIGLQRDFEKRIVKTDETIHVTLNVFFNNKDETIHVIEEIIPDNFIVTDPGSGFLADNVIKWVDLKNENTLSVSHTYQITSKYNEGMNDFLGYYMIEGMQSQKEITGEIDVLISNDGTQQNIEFNDVPSDDSASSSSSNPSLDHWSETNIKDNELEKEISIDFSGLEVILEKGKKIKLNLKDINEEHHITLDNIGILKKSATILIESTPQKAKLNIGDTIKFDLNNDQILDLYVDLVSIESSDKAKLLLMQINEDYALQNTALKIQGNVVRENKVIEKIIEYPSFSFVIIAVLALSIISISYVYRKDEKPAKAGIVQNNNINEKHILALKNFFSKVKQKNININLAVNKLIERGWDREIIYQALREHS